MDSIIAFIAIFLSIVLTQNFVLSQFLGICPFVGVSKDTSSAFGMGLAVTFVMTLASLVTWILSWFILAENVKLANAVTEVNHVQVAHGVEQLGFVENIHRGINHS